MSPAIKIEFDQFQLENGLRVIFHHDSKLPVAHVNLWYHVGSKNEGPGRTGFAHLFEHLMFQGSRNANGSFLTYMEKIGASLREGGVNGTTSFDRTNYFETAPREALECVLWLEADRMGFLADALTQEKLDNQRDVVKNERRQSYENVPYGRTLETILKNIFPPGHPYSWMVIGSQEDLDGAELEDFKQFFRSYYSPSNCSLAVAGDFDPRQARQWIENYFGPLEPGPPLERMQAWGSQLLGEKRVMVHDRVPQERLHLVWPSPAYFQPGDAALDLTSRLLAQGKNSRLYKRLVYDQQIASDVSAFNYSLEIGGLFGIVATARPGHDLRQIEQAIDEEIARFARQGPAPGELECEKAKHEFDYVTGLERIGGFGGKADLLNQYATYLGSPDGFQRDYDRYQSLTIEELRDVVGKHLATRQRLAVTFVPEESKRPVQTSLDRSLAPHIAARKDFVVPHFETVQLSNGLNIVVSERRDLPKVSVGLVVGAGATADPAGKAGAAWMAAAMLDEGTASRTALDIQAELDRQGSILQTYAETEISQINLECLKRNLPSSLELLADVALHPAFPEEELERQRKRRLDAILQERHNPASLARKLFRSTLFGQEHPLGREVAGNEASIQRLAIDDLRTCYQRHWKPNQAALIFAGDVSMDEAVALAERLFGEWPPQASPSITLPPVALPSQTRLVLADRPDAPQSQLRLGSLGPARKAEDFYAIELCNAIFGGAFTSRLNLNLREQKGYTYGAFSAFSYGRQMGLWVCGAAVHTRFSKEALLEILQELGALHAEKPITEAELEMARSNLIQGFAQRFETLERLVDQATETITFGLPLSVISQFPHAIREVALAQVQAAASRYLQASQLTGVVVGDLRQIEKALRDLALGDIHIVDSEGKEIG